MLLVGFCGPKRAGKNFAATILKEHLEEKYPGLICGEIAFAQVLRDIATLAVGEENRRIFHAPYKNVFNGFLGQVPRDLLISTGRALTGVLIHDEKFQTYATRRALARLEDAKFQIVLITDVRFPDEAKLIKDSGGVVIEIERDGYDYDSGEPTESGLPHNLIDFTLSDLEEDQGSRIAECLPSSWN